MSDQVKPPSVGHQWQISLGKLDTTVDLPLSGTDWTLTPAGVYVSLGCTRNVKVKLPSQPNKPIPCGVEAAQWMVPGRKELGTLDIQSLDFAEVPEDILDFNDTRCVAKLETLNEEEEVVRTIYCVDWRPVIDLDVPDGDGETTVNATGPYSRAVIEFAS